jgi:hypothetical protein
LALFYVQLKLIRESLEPAKAAAEAAKESANAAHRAIDESEKRDRVLNRAYLTPGFGLLSEINGEPVIHVGIRNTGRTIGILLTVHHALVPEEDFDAGDFAYTKFTGREDAVIPHPLVEVRSGVLYKLSEMPKISSGWITYTDIFGTTWRQAWKHRLYSNGASDSLPGCYSPTYRPWETEGGT